MSETAQVTITIVGMVAFTIGLNAIVPWLAHLIVRRDRVESDAAD